MMPVLQPRPWLLLLGPAFLIDTMIPPITQDAAHIPSTDSNNNENSQALSGQNASPGINRSISLNARRLQLRNAGFRAALLPTRRLTPPRQPGIDIPASRLGNIENTNPGYANARRSSPLNNTSPVTVLQEIRNCSQRRSNPSSPLGELFGFADDEKENTNGTSQTTTMASRTGSIKAPKNRKSLKRAPSFQSVKYIEYLENELGAATKKLESMQSSEPSNVQSAKIRKLEKRTLELSQHLEDWEKNFEERVNDAVFEKVHGESSLRLQILNLEQTVAHKETHVTELSKELEDAKIRLAEAETIESTLTRRVDVLTELLARSPTRASFSLSAAESLMPAKAAKPTIHRIATSPAKSRQKSEDLDRRKSYIHSVASPIDYLAANDNDYMTRTEVENEDLSEASRPVSGVFSSYSGHAPAPRPISMFSISSLSTWTSADERPPARARKSRRFAPGATGLKPLLLSASTGIDHQMNTDETPQRNRAQHQNGDDSYWESSEDLMSPTPSRPGPRKPDSWTHRFPTLKASEDPETRGSDDDTLIASTCHVDDISPYLGSPTADAVSDSIMEAFSETLSLPARRSLFQELSIQQQSFDSFLDDIDLAQEHPFFSRNAEGLRESADSATERNYFPRPRSLRDTDYQSISRVWSASIRSDAERASTMQSDSNTNPQPRRSPIQSPQTFFRSIIAILNTKTLDIARWTLLQSWSRNSTQFIRIVRRIMSTFLLPQQDEQSILSPLISKSSVREPLAVRGADDFGRAGHQKEDHSQLLRSRSESEALTISTSTNHCSCCDKATERQRHTLMMRLMAAFALAAGYSLLKCPTVAG